MKSLIAAIIALTCLAFSNGFAQSRSLGARMFTIDNGPGNTLTFVYIGDGGDTIDFPPTGAALPEGTFDQTLRYDGEAWVASSNLLNSTEIATVGGGVDHRTSYIVADSALTDLEYDVVLNPSDSTLEITLPAAVDGQVIRLTNVSAGKSEYGVILFASDENSIDGSSSFYGLDGTYSSVTFVASNGTWFLIDALRFFGQGG